MDMHLSIATLQFFLSTINVLIIPVLWYVVRLEKRISIIETRVEIHDKYARDNLDLIRQLATDKFNNNKNNV